MIKKKITAMFFCYRLIDFRLLLTSGIFKNCSNKMRIVVIVPKSSFNECKKILPKDIIVRILNHKIAKQESYKANQKTKLENFLRNILSLTYANNPNYKKCLSPEPQRSAFFNSESSKGLIKKLSSMVVIFLSFIGSNFFFVRKFIQFLLFFLLKNSSHKKLYEEFNPDITIVGSMGLDADAQVIWEAKNNKVKTLVINQSWDRTVCKGYPVIHPDYHLVWNYHMKFESMYYLDMPKNSIFIEGAAIWDYIFKKDGLRDKYSFFSAMNLDVSKKTVYYPLTPLFWHDELLKNLDQFKLAKINKKISNKIQIIFRVHPYYWIAPEKIRNQLFSKLKKLEDIKGFFVDYNKVIGTKDSYILKPEDQEFLVNVYHHSDICISVLSSSMMEMIFCGKPSINYVFGKLKMRGQEIQAKDYFLHHINHLYSFKIIKNVHVFNDIIYELNNIDNFSIDKKLQEKVINSEISYNRGTASKAYANRILSLAKLKKNNY